MEENVALDSTKQKQFAKSVKGIKKLIKLQKSEDKAKSEAGIAKNALKGQDGKDRKKKRKRGLVYLSHIPHGFYEHEMTQYFKQFGVVTNARVIRSKRTGNSKGCAFVEFREPAVAQIVAETMNNYLMGKRLLKAVYIPPQKQRPAMRKNWSSTHNPGREHGLKIKKAYNADKDEKGDLQKAKKLLANLSKTKSKLSELGISYDFFTPVDVPEVLQNNVQVKIEKTDEEENDSAKNKKAKKGKKLPQADVEVSQKDHKVKVKATLKPNVKNEQKSKKDLKVQDTKPTKKEQKQKKQTLKDKGVQPLEEFVKIGEDTDSDSSYAFDSDEYSKMIENEDESNSYESGNESDNEAESDDGIGDDSEVSESDGDILRYEDSDKDLPPTPKQKTKPVQKAAQKVAQPVVKKNAKKQEAKKPVQMKRKATEKLVSPKKPKFERQNQRSLNKQFKKKK